MSTNFDRIAEAWLAEGPTQLADRVFEAALDEVHMTRQRRRLPVQWRLNRWSAALRFASAVGLAIAVIGVFLINLPARDDIGGQSPTPSAEPSASVPPSATPAWQTFTSNRFGYSVMLPGDFVQVPNTGGLPETLFPGDQSDWADRFDEPVSHSPFLVVAVATPQTPKTLADVAAEYDELLAGSCDTSTPAAMTVAGQPARLIVASCVPWDWFDVTVEHAGRLYVIQWNWTSLSASPDAARPTFDRILGSFLFTD